MPNLFDEYATEVLEQPQVMDELTDWFDSDKPRSALEFGIALGRLDGADKVTEQIISWLRNGQCKPLVIGYLHGLQNRLGSLPEEWVERIEAVSHSHSEYAAALTLQLDRTSRGFERIFGLVDSGMLPVGYLNGFAQPAWGEVLKPQEKGAILQKILELRTDDSPTLVNLALGLIVTWTVYGKAPIDRELLASAMALLRTAVSTKYVSQHEWGILLDLIAQSNPREAAEIAVEVIRTPRSSSVVLEATIGTTLATLAQSHSEIVMDVVGRCLLDRAGRAYFNIFRFRGLFDRIGLPVLKKWIETHGADALPAIAWQLSCPYVNKDGTVVVPPVWEWVCSQSEESFRKFCDGCHSGEVKVGYAKDRRPALAESMKPFLSHESTLVRRWAETVMAENERDSVRDEHLNEWERF
jgi:hypothetical protein